jgi:hypothetical protein
MSSTVRRSSLVLLIAAALLVAASAADAKPKRCGKQAIAIGPKKRPKACVPKVLPKELGPQVLKAAKPLRKGARRSPKGERMARELLAVLRPRLEAGQPAIAKPGTLASATASPRAGASGAVWANAAPDAVETTAGETTATWHRQGHEIRAVETDGFVETEARDHTGAGGSMGYGERHEVASCPTAAGDVPAKYQETLTFGRAASKHGKRYFIHFTLEHEGTWKGHVGLGGKAETFDLDMRGTLEIRSGVEIAATGKVLHREPTRTYRTALTKSRLPVGTNPTSVIRDMRLRGPKGARITDADVEPLSTLAAFTSVTVMRVSYQLETGDRRWYDARACAKIDYTSSPERVRKGGQAEWDATVLADDGTPASDAIWTTASTCGTLTASTTRGAKTHLTVTDSASNWSYEPSRPACVTADVTSPAGRARLGHSIAAEEEHRYRFDVTVRYREDAGAGVTPTNMDGRGRAEAGVGEEDAPAGAGTYTGTEWDERIDNPCGADMQAVRAFSGTATVGADIQDDGTATVAWVAYERPLRMNFIVNVPLTPGTHVVNMQGTQPYCGDRSEYEAVIGVTISRIG